MGTSLTEVGIGTILVLVVVIALSAALGKWQRDEHDKEIKKMKQEGYFKRWTDFPPGGTGSGE